MPVGRKGGLLSQRTVGPRSPTPSDSGGRFSPSRPGKRYRSLGQMESTMQHSMWLRFIGGGRQAQTRTSEFPAARNQGFGFSTSTPGTAVNTALMTLLLIKARFRIR